MTKLNLFLLLLLILCALSVVTSSHRARKLYSELQKEESVKRKLDLEWGQLQLEQSTWAIHSRVESEAAKRLGMQIAPSERIQPVLRNGEPIAKQVVKDRPL